MRSIHPTEYAASKKLQTLREYGRTICGNTVLLPDGTIRAAIDLVFVEKLEALYIYKFKDDTVYQL